MRRAPWNSFKLHLDKAIVGAQFLYIWEVNPKVLKVVSVSSPVHNRFLVLEVRSEGCAEFLQIFMSQDYYGLFREHVCLWV